MDSSSPSLSHRSRLLDLPRPLQLLLLLIGVQVVARAWPSPEVPELPAETALEAGQLLHGDWVAVEGEERVHIDAHSMTLTRDGASQSVAYRVVSFEGETVGVELEHDPPTARLVCRVGDRLDLDCPTGIWFREAGS